MFKEDLIKVLRKEKISAHMPGHKYQSPFTSFDYELDTTEIEGTDNLFHATGIIKDAMEHASLVYGSDQTHFLVGGSTAGILASILGATNPSDTILIGRDCHQSVYHACMLNRLSYETISPQWNSNGTTNGYDLKKVKKRIEENDEIRVVVLTSPSYYGYVTELKSLIELMNSRSGLVIIDEAHGAHLNFGSTKKHSALSMNAHIVIQSAHKTLPAMTQTGLIHFKNAEKWYENVLEYLKIVQSSSPSYVLLNSIDEAIYYMVENTRKQDLFFDVINNYKEHQLARWQFGVDKQEDPMKIWLHTKHVGYSGYEINQRLMEHGIYAELCNFSGVLLYLSIMNTEEELKEIVEVLNGIEVKEPLIASGIEYPESIKILVDEDVRTQVIEKLPFKEAIGKVSKQKLVPYPPGIPLIMPGELITKEHVDILMHLLSVGHEIIGLSKETETIKVVK